MSWFRIRVLIVTIVLMALVPPALAFDGRSGNVVRISPDETVRDDLYAAASEVIVEGTIEGSLFAAGRRIWIRRTASITRNVIAAAQEIEIEEGARIGGDLIVAGQAIRMNGHAGGSLIGAGNTLRMGGTLEGDLIFGGGEAFLTGQVGRDGIAGANRLELQGHVGRNMWVEITDMRFGPEARIQGELRYRAPRELSIPSGVVSGSTRFLPRGERRPEEARPLALLIHWLRRSIGLVLIGAAMLTLAPAWTREMAGQMQKHLLSRLGSGLLLLLLLAAGLLVGLFLTILMAILTGVLTLGDLAWRALLAGFLVLGGALFLIHLLWVYLSPVFAGIALGQRILRLRPMPVAMERWLAMLLGTILIALLTVLPYAGFWISLVVALLGLGAIGSWLRESLRRPASSGSPGM